MKKLFFAAIVAVTVASSAFAAPTKVSRNVERSFKNDFANAQSVTWGSAGNYTSVGFLQNNKSVKAFYDAAGELVATSTAITVEQLPTDAKRLLAKRYQGYTISEAISFVQEGQTSYYVSAQNQKETIILQMDNSGTSVFSRTIK